MKKELVEKLHHDWPGLFGRKIEPSCRDGWYPIIYNLCNIISTHIAYTYSQEVWGQFCISQIKEKFGGLRFYMNHEDDYISGAIVMAEMHSDMMCEVCGHPGSKYTVGGWIQTLCPHDYDLQQAEHEKRMAESLRELAEKKAKK